MAGDLPTDKGKGKEPVKDEQAQAANGAKESEDKTTADGKKPATDLPSGVSFCLHEDA